MASNITSANATLILSLPLILPTPQQIQGFGMDDAFSSSQVASVQTRMGVDGQLSGGYVPTEKKVEITLAASSDSNAFFDTWQAQQDANLTAYIASGVLTYPSIGRTFVMTLGYLTGYMPIASAKKVLQERRFEITWRNIINMPIGQAG